MNKCRSELHTDKNFSLHAECMCVCVSVCMCVWGGRAPRHQTQPGLHTDILFDLRPVNVIRIWVFSCIININCSDNYNYNTADEGEHYGAREAGVAGEEGERMT